MRKHIVAVLDEYPLLEVGISGIFDGMSEFEFVGSVKNIKSSGTYLECASIIVFGIVIEESLSTDGLQEEFPSARLLQIIRPDDAKMLATALRNGVAGCLSSRCTPAEVVRAARSVGNGERYLSPDLAGKLMTFSAQSAKPRVDPFATLTSREEQILELLGIGLSNKEIGWRLTISEKTVKHYLTSILDKLNVQNRVQAALLFAGRQTSLSYA